MQDRTKVHVTHPDVEGVAYVQRSALKHMDGWSEVSAPERAGKPTPRRTAAAKKAASPTPATATSEPILAAEVAELKES